MQTSGTPQQYFIIGACGENPGPTETPLIAITWPDYLGFDFAHCGACYNITGPNGTTTVKVFDWWPESTAGGLAWWMTHVTPYNYIGCANTFGCQDQIHFQLVPCPLSLRTSGMHCPDALS